jgi:hypothetical protein
MNKIMLIDFKAIAGFWFKESDSFKNNFEYLYISDNGNNVVSSVLLSKEPKKVVFIYASLEVVDSKIIATNKRTKNAKENYFKYANDCLSWSIDGVEFRTWKRVTEGNIVFIPKEIILEAQK